MRLFLFEEGAGRLLRRLHERGHAGQSLSRRLLFRRRPRRELSVQKADSDRHQLARDQDPVRAHPHRDAGPEQQFHQETGQRNLQKPNSSAQSLFGPQQNRISESQHLQGTYHLFRVHLSEGPASFLFIC